MPQDPQGLSDNSNEGKKISDVDTVLRQIGQLGPFQIRILAIFLPIFFSIAYQSLIMVFTAYEPPWMCAKQSESCLQSNSSSADSLVVYSTATQPIELYERRCTLNRSDWKFADENLYEGPHNTIVDEFDLVCDRAFLGWLANAILYFGWAVGSLVLGTVADKCGRKNVLFPSLTVMLVVTFAMAFAKAVWVVLAFRFIIGVCQSGAFQSIFVLSTELVGPEKRALATAALWFYYTGALMVLGLKAYLVRDWRMLMILSSAPWIFILVFWKFVPESVRWLLVKGEKEKARAILENAAKVNKKPLLNKDLYVPGTTENKGVVELFKTWKRAKLSLTLIYLLYVNGVVYFGLALSSGEFGGSIYFNFVITSLVEIPANALFIHNCNRFGRKKTTIAYMIAAGIAVVAVSFIPHGTDNAGFIAGRVALGTLGKLCITTSFGAVDLLAAELYPTVVRNSGIAMVFISGHIGAATSPFLVQLTRINAVLPFAVMGALSVIGAILCWTLPETLGRKTAEVWEDAEDSKGTMV
ncbi:unnamed protein product, partial [Porites evermanni]